MKVLVTKYTDYNELHCRIISPDEKSGKEIVVDPFVTCAVSCDDAKIKEIGKSMVGHEYEMSEEYINSFGVFCPSIFKKIIETNGAVA